MLECYIDKINEYLDYESKIDKAINFITIEEVYNNVRLKVIINKENHQILAVNFNKNINDILKGVLNAFCEVVVELPIIEAVEHSTIKLEYLLRKDGCKPVEGIILPQNTLAEFQTINKIIKKIYSNYQKLVNYYPEGNFYQKSIDKKWKALSDEEKILELAKLVKKFMTNYSIYNCDFHLRLLNITRVELLIDEKIDNIGSLLLNLEKFIQKNINLPIEIMYLEQLDKNKARIKEGVR